MKQYTGITPTTLGQLKTMGKCELQKLWSCYFPSGKPLLRPLWHKIQCGLAGISIEQKHISKLNAYANNPDDGVEKSHKVKYHIRAGTQLVKKFKGRECVVQVNRPDEFAYAGKVYKTLSAVATEICGHKVSGYDFFGFNNKK